MICTALGRDRQGLHERAQQSLLSQLVALPTLGVMRLLTEDFRLPLFGSDSARMLDCIRNARQSGLGPLVWFGFGLNKDISAVSAGVETVEAAVRPKDKLLYSKSSPRKMYASHGLQSLALARRTLRCVVPP
jgi:hypothetical protein